MKRYSHCKLICAPLAFLFFPSVPLKAQTQQSSVEGSSRVIFPDRNRGVTSEYSGPWGRLTFREVIIETPQESLGTNRALTEWKGGTRWKYRGDVPSLCEVLGTAGFSAAEIDRLTSPPVLRKKDGYLDIRPPEEMILRLAKPERGYLYSKLGTGDPLDPFEMATQLAPGGIDRIAGTNSGLPTHLIDTLSKLSYSRRTGIQYFSDFDYVFAKAESDAQRIRIIQFLSREPAGVVELLLENTTDRNPSIVDYWTAGGRNPDAAGVLSSALENPEIRSLEIIHLLPIGPRKLLNSYPTKESSIGEDYPDCFGTSLSFFDEEIPPRFLEPLNPDLMAYYEPATRPWQFGDIVAIMGASGKWFHACNYIAGEIVFTKNGKSPERPWVLQTMDDVFASYLREDSLTIAFFRLKPTVRR